MIQQRPKTRRKRTREVTTAVGYVRVSTDEQAQDGLSIEAQTAAIEAEAKRLGLELLDVYRDEGVSGRRMDRAGLYSALSVATHHGSALIAYSLSRLSRSSSLSLAVIEELDRAGAHLVVIQEGLCSIGTCGRMVLGVLASVYQHQAEAGAETTASVLRHVRASGRKTGGSVPYGFTADERGYLHEDPEEQAVIDRMRELRQQGVSYRKLADQLTSEGLHPRGVTSTGTRTSGRWHIRQLVRILGRT